jgi:hypothetical protein
MRLHEEFGLSVSDDTIYRALHKLGFPHLSAQPRAYKQDAEAIAAFKNFAARVADIRQNLPPDTPIEVWFQMLWGRAALIFRPARTKQGSQPACNRAEHLFGDRAEHLTWLLAARLPTSALACTDGCRRHGSAPRPDQRRRWQAVQDNATDMLHSAHESQATHASADVGAMTSAFAVSSTPAATIASSTLEG